MYLISVYYMRMSADFQLYVTYQTMQPAAAGKFETDIRKLYANNYSHRVFLCPIHLAQVSILVILLYAPLPFPADSFYFLTLPDYQPSMAMVFFVSTAFASFFGMLSLRIPSSNFALISSWVNTSPT